MLRTKISFIKRANESLHVSHNEKDVIVAFFFSILSCTISSPSDFYEQNLYKKGKKSFFSGSDFWSSFHPKLKSLPIEGEEERGWQQMAAWIWAVWQMSRDPERPAGVRWCRRPVTSVPSATRLGCRCRAIAPRPRSGAGAGATPCSSPGAWDCSAHWRPAASPLQVGAELGSNRKVEKWNP